MANCPNCGSEHIQLKKDTDVDWGRAVAGWALFGVVGGAVGAITGEDRNANACLDCGTSWKAADLYKTRQVIKKLTDVTLDLSHEKDRCFLNDFVEKISPYIEVIPKIQKDAEEHIKKIENQYGEKAAVGCGYGCLTAIGGCTATASLLSGSGIAVLFVLCIPPFIGLVVGSLLDQANKKTIEQEVQKAKKEAERVKKEAEYMLKKQVADFIVSHPL
jgi:hypothetical protein